MTSKHPVEANPNARLEALSDGVFAIALTLLVLDVRIGQPAAITGTAALWHSLRDLGPTVFAMILSFGVILITWVNHHHTLRHVARSSGPFIYANGFLLLTVAILPFPTSLLGEFLPTDHAAPAVVLYNTVLVVQAMAWILVTGAALGGGLAVDDRAATTLRTNHRYGYAAMVFYLILAVVAFWLPLVVAVVTTVSWMAWLIRSMQIERRP